MTKLHNIAMEFLKDLMYFLCDLLITRTIFLNNLELMAAFNECSNIVIPLYLRYCFGILDLYL